ncbi:MAG TPA: 6-aminohexanoate hydrolase [Cytophagales bacterium]|nr:6-aminohexanoate hydrolase [Cytophagales bacterium]HAA18967.1 6-aminohexanoate hydrolase [Cytophagales bacterium]HAP61867.1 6-aminohexanoate hydrolase [Cytophagales bacterium]
MKRLLLLFPLFVGCAQQPSDLEQLKAYEGLYEGGGNSTLEIMASGFDTTLYAIIDEAKYPLSLISGDTFHNLQKIPVVFTRDAEGQVSGYQVGGQAFGRISDHTSKWELFPREELYENPEAYRYQPPEVTDDGLAVGDVQAAFEKPELIREMVVETIKGNYPDVHSILIMKDDELVLEEYFYGYDVNTPHQLRSATKSFLGALVGLTVDQALIPSEKEPLLPYFAERYPDLQNPAVKDAITIEDFLRYRNGLDCDNDNPESAGNETDMMRSSDWVKHTLDLPLVTEPGTTTLYCTGSALTMGSLVEIVTEQDIEDYARQHLFGPLGITNYQWTFEPNPKSINTFSQMYITPRDLVKLAKVYLDQGKWEGQQILSERWVQDSFQSEDGHYGYLWKHKYWVLDGKRYDSYMATGNGGQKINVWPELNMITVFTGGNYNSYALYGKSTPPNEMIPGFILKAGPK